MSDIIRSRPEDIRMSDAFDALMWATARPGVPRPLAEPGIVPLAQSLLDRETSFHADGETVDTALGATGARRLPLREADYLFVSLRDRAAVSRLAPARIGSALYPDEAATVFAPARFGDGQRLRLAGPGIDGTVELCVAGVDSSFWPARDAAARYPLGWDVYLVGEGELVGLPRSTSVEVM